MRFKNYHAVAMLGWMVNIVYWSSEILEYGFSNLDKHFWNAPREHIFIILQIPLFMLVGYFIYKMERNIAERKRAEEALSASQEFSRSLIDSSLDMIIAVDNNRRITEFNKAAEKTFGYKKEEVLGKHVSILYVDVQQGNEVHNIVKEKGHHIANVLNKRKNSEIFPAILAATPLVNSNGVIIGVMGISRDITEWKRAQDALKRRDAILIAISVSASLLLKTSSWTSVVQDVLKQFGTATKVNRVYIFKNHTDEEGSVLSSQYCEWVSDGIDPQIGAPELQNFPYIAGGMKRWLELLSKNQPIYGLVKDFPDSERIILEPQDIKSLLALPIFIDNEWWGFIGFDDCTIEREWSKQEIDILTVASSILGFAIKREKSEYALKESEKKFRTVFEESRDAIYISTVDGFLTDFSQSMEDLLGYNREELLNLSLSNTCVKKDDRIRFQQEIVNRGFIKDYEISLLKKDGTIIYCLETASVRKDHKGKIIGYQGIIRDITERKKAEQTLRENERKYKNLFRLIRSVSDNMVDMLWAKDMDKKYIFANEALCYGLLNARDINEPIGKTDMWFAERERKSHPENLQWHTFGEICQDSDQVILDTKKPGKFSEYGNVKGKFIFLEVHKSPLLNGKGEMIGIVGSARDVTKEKEIQENLMDSEEQFRSLSNTANDAIIGMDDKKSIQIWNKAASRLFGYTHSETFGKELHDLIVPEQYRQQFNGAYKKFLKTGKGNVIGKTVELTGLKKNGKVFPIELSISPVKRRGKWHATGIIRDITKRKEAEELIKESEKKYRTLFEESNDTIYITRLDGKILEMSPAGERLFGYSRDELLKMDVHRLYAHPEDRKIFQQAMQERGSVNNYAVRLNRKDRTIRDCLISASTWKDSNGKIVGYQGIIRDVTEETRTRNELKEALVKAEEADRVKSLFLANMSHEIRTPLNTVLGFTELVEHIVKDKVAPEEREFFKTIRTSGERLSHTIHEILNISQIEAGTFQTHLKKHNLVEILEAATTPLKSKADEKGLEFTVRSTVSKAPVFADEYCAIQAISNIVENAIKYTPKGKVDVLLKKTKNTFNVNVNDTGEGIAEENLQEIFKEFKQESEGYTKKYQGVGLGLALVKKYLYICKAEINVKSKKGVGSTFILKFPHWKGSNTRK